MSPDDKSTPLAPVVLTVVGTGDGLVSGAKATTPAGQPNIIIQVVTPAAALLIRFANVYIGMVVGLLATAMTSNAIPAPDFWSLLVKCAGLAIGGAVVLSLKDVITVLGKLEGRWPLLTGNI